MKLLKKTENQGHCRCTVHVVIAVNHHFFAPCDRLFDTADRQVHILHQKRVVELFQGRPEKRLCVFKIRDPALHQQTREVAVNPQQFRHFPDAVAIPLRLYDPTFLHIANIMNFRDTGVLDNWIAG